MGTVDVTREQLTYSPGEVVTLTATADNGWTFTGWSGDLVSTSSPVTITMDADKVITATFIEVHFQVTLTIIGDGSVDNYPGNPYTYGQTAVLEPVADPGWSFESWSGADSGDLIDNSDGTWNMIMDGDKDITATFVRNQQIIFIPLTLK